MIRSLLLVSLFVLPAVAQAQAPPPYEASIQAHRDSIRTAFLDPETPPLQPDEIAAFSGLDYYDVDPAYRVTARFERVEGDEPVAMNTSGGDIRDYRRFGTLHFEIGGAPLTLAAYQSVVPPEDPAYTNYLAIPFRDATSGGATYAAGRYLDLTIPEGDEVVLDFNEAYAPYCAYSPRYSCILPPPENRLTVAVEAGVKKYDVWTGVVSEEGGYSIAFPGPPLDQAQPNENGLTLHMQTFEQGEAAYFVMHTVTEADFDTLSASELAGFFDAAQQGGAQGFGGTLGHAEEIELDGVPGRSFEVNAPEQSLYGRSRMFASGRMLYQILVLTEGRRPDGPEADRFLDSFRILEGGATPRLQRLLDEAGYEYTVDDDGDYKLTFSTTGERTHLVVISTYTPDLTLVPSYEVWALVGRGLSELPAGLAEALLRRSGDLPALSAQLYGGSDGEPMLVALSTVVEQGVSVAALQRVVEQLALEADELEARFVGTDDL
ncbi:MAG: DUF1684 domain-containing protein [Rhodothermales bacterium]